MKKKPTMMLPTIDNPIFKGVTPKSPTKTQIMQYRRHYELFEGPKIQKKTIEAAVKKTIRTKTKRILTDKKAYRKEATSGLRKLDKTLQKPGKKIVFGGITWDY